MYATTILLVFISAFLTGTLLGGFLIYKYRYVPLLKAFDELVEESLKHIERMRDRLGLPRSDGTVKSPIQLTKDN